MTPNNISMTCASRNRKMQPVTIIVVRHGQTQWNVEGRWQGTLDSPLTELGRKQALDAAKIVAEYRLDAVYSSPVGRAVETARIILSSSNLPIIPVEALRERDHGVYEGLNAAEIEERYPGTRYRDCGVSRETWAPPEGESMAEVRERVRQFLLDLASRHSGQTVLLVTHSGVVRAVDSLCQGASFDEIWDRVPLNGCVYVARVYRTGQFECVRDCFQLSPVLETHAEKYLASQ